MDLSRILVATDLSERSTRAVERAVRLSVQHGSELRILHVVDDALPAPVAREVRTNAKAHLKETVASIHKDVVRRTQIDIRLGTIWKTILEAAEETGAGLIILGSHRSHGIADSFPGTTLDRVAKRAHVPVLKAISDAKAGYRNVAVGVDFSPAAQIAVVCAATLAPDARMTLASTYHVFFKEFIDRAEPGDSDVRAEKRRIERELQEQMYEFLKSCPQRSDGYKTTFLEGGTVNVLSALVRTKDVDLICVGAHGRSWLAEAFLGSTARELLSSAPCDVLVATS